MTDVYAVIALSAVIVSCVILLIMALCYGLYRLAAFLVRKIHREIKRRRQQAYDRKNPRPRRYNFIG